MLSTTSSKSRVLCLLVKLLIL